MIENTSQGPSGRESKTAIGPVAFSDLAVVVFNYNYAAFLPDALHGLQQQCRPPDHVLVSDDCSPSDSAEELQRIVAAFPGVKFVRNGDNLGAVEHFRRRVAGVSAKYYMVHSADDFLIDPRFFHDAVELLEGNAHLVAVFGYAGDLQPNGHVVLPRAPAPDRDHTLLKGEELRVQLAYENVIPAVCVVIRTEVHRRLPPFPISNPHVHDWQQWYLMTYLGDFARLERVVCHKHIHGDNLSENFETSGVAGMHVDSGYRQLLERPEIGTVDQRHLLIGRRRHAIRTASALSLPWILLREFARPGVLGAFSESVCERLARRFRALRKLRRREFLKKYAGDSW